MNIDDLVKTRRSIRAFVDREVPLDTLKELLSLAARAPSGGNVQPWHFFVLTGPQLAAFKALMQKRLLRGPSSDVAEYAVYPQDLWEPHRSARFAVGEQMYALLDVPREDRAGRLRHFARNFDFFGASAALFCYVDRRMGPPQWSDLGMYLQTLMLLLKSRGLDSCAQECWEVYHQTVTAFVQPPAELMLFCGMAIGYADPDAAINQLQSERLQLDAFASFFHEAP